MAEKAKPERATTLAEPAHDDNALVEVADQAAYAALFRTDSPIATLERAQELVQYVGTLIAPRRERYIADFSGKKYAMQPYWGVYDMALGVSKRTCPVESFEVRGKPELEAYKCRVELSTHGGVPLGSGEAVCTAAEPNPQGGKWVTHALFSKTQTRADVKAHRLTMPLIPLLDGLDPISYEEVVESPIAFPGDGLDWDDVCDDIKVGLKHLGWGDTKARSRLAKFLNTDGTLDEDKAVAFLSAELAKADQEAGR